MFDAYITVNGVDHTAQLNRIETAVADLKVKTAEIEQLRSQLKTPTDALEAAVKENV
jgi:outer membrane murein-binding lipoprotein Lpp